MLKTRALLVNKHEEATDRELRELAASHDARVCPKVGLKDVVNLSGLPRQLYQYGLKAHLDFVVIDDSTNQPLFAVEADGSSHDDPVAHARDKMKDEIVERAGLSLLRVEHDFMRTFGRFTVLAWLVEIWFLRQAWDEAVDRGDVPPEEPFCHWSFVESDNAGRIVGFPYDLAAGAKRFLIDAWKQGKIPRFNPEIRLRADVFNRKRAYTEAYALLETVTGAFLIESGRCRTFNFPGVGPWDLAEDLAEIAVAEKLKSYLRGEVAGASRDEMDSVLAKTNDWRAVGEPFTKSLHRDQTPT